MDAAKKNIQERKKREKGLAIELILHDDILYHYVNGNNLFVVLK